MYQDRQVITINDIKLNEGITEGTILIQKVRDDKITFRLDVPKVYKYFQTTMSLKDFERFQSNLRNIGFNVHNTAYYNL